MTQTFDPFDPEAWSDATGCEAFEQALMMRAQSALAPHAVPVLEAHLTACEACRDHAARMSDVDATLATYRGDEIATTSWERVHDRLHANVRRYQRRTPWTIALAGAGGLGAVALAHALLDPGPTHVVGMLATFAIYLAGMGLVYRVASHHKDRLLDNHDVIATYRGELERQLRIARAGTWLWPIVIACELPRSIHAFTQTLDGNVHAHARLTTGALLIILAIAAFSFALVKTRRARRELVGLK